MSLAVGDIVEVRVAYRGSYSYGRIYADSTLGEAVWCEFDYIHPQEFGDAHYYARVYNLAYTKLTVTRPQVSIIAYKSGGARAVSYQLQPGSQYVANLLDASDAIITTDLGDLGNIENYTPAEYHPTTNLIRRVPNPRRADKDGDCCLSTIQSGQSNIDAWLAANKPELGSAVTFAVFVSYDSFRVSGTVRSEATCSAVFTLSMLESGWSCVATQSKSARSIKTSVEVCSHTGSDPESETNLWQANSPDVGVFVTGVTDAARASTPIPTNTTLSGTSNTLLSPRLSYPYSPYEYGFDLSVTRDTGSRMTAISVLPYAEPRSGWTTSATIENITLICKRRAGALAS